MDDFALAHRELLETIKEKDLSYSHPDSVFTMNDRTNKALYAAVELHKPVEMQVFPDEFKFRCIHCDPFGLSDPDYPCETIRTIAEELEK